MIERLAALRARELMLVAAPIVFAFACVEAAASVLAGWPYQFTGPGAPDQVPRDFLSRGTLLSPPLPLLALFGVLALLIRKRGGFGVAANAALPVLCAIVVVGSLGEALSPKSSDVPHALQLAGNVLGAVVFAALLALSVLALWRPRFSAAA
jgi:hypothetical protein